MFRGIAAHHRAHMATLGFAELSSAVTRGYPVLRMLALATSLGVSWRDGEGQLAIKGAPRSWEEAEGSIRAAVESTGVGSDFLGPLWEIGVHEMRDIVTNGGKKLIDAAGLMRRVRSANMVGPPQRRALRALTKALADPEGKLACVHWLDRRGGVLKAAWSGRPGATLLEQIEAERVEVHQVGGRAHPTPETQGVRQEVRLEGELAEDERMEEVTSSRTVEDCRVAFVYCI
jgi:hypothetical protein